MGKANGDEADDGDTAMDSPPSYSALERSLEDKSSRNNDRIGSSGPAVLVVPKLKFSKVRALKLCVLGHASRSGEVSAATMTELCGDEEFCGHVFDLMDLNGDGMLETREVRKNHGPPQ